MRRKIGGGEEVKRGEEKGVMRGERRDPVRKRKDVIGRKETKW